MRIIVNKKYKLIQVMGIFYWYIAYTASNLYWMFTVIYLFL